MQCLVLVFVQSLFAMVIVMPVGRKGNNFFFFFSDFEFQKMKESVLWYRISLNSKDGINFYHEPQNQEK